MCTARGGKRSHALGLGVVSSPGASERRPGGFGLVARRAARWAWAPAPVGSRRNACRDHGKGASPTRCRRCAQVAAARASSRSTRTAGAAVQRGDRILLPWHSTSLDIRLGTMRTNYFASPLRGGVAAEWSSAVVHIVVVADCRSWGFPLWRVLRSKCAVSGRGNARCRDAPRSLSDL